MLAGRSSTPPTSIPLRQSETAPTTPPAVATRILADTDLAVPRSADLPVAVAGLPYSYTVTVTNNGPKPATTVTVRGLLPEGSNLSYAPPECTYDGFVLTCQLAGLPAGNTWTLPVVVDVWPETRGFVTNTVRVESLETDPNGGNNSAVAVNPVLAVADLSMVTTAADDVVAGTPLTYTLSVANRRPIARHRRGSDQQPCRPAPPRSSPPRPPSRRPETWSRGRWARWRRPRRSPSAWR